MQGQTNQDILAPKLQRRLRNNMTDAERKLWQGLRAQQLSGHKFRRQHSYYDFILDFVCLDQKLIVEVDGGQHANSESDRRRDDFLQKGGFRVLRFWNNDVLTETDAVLEAIYRALVQPHHPHPDPPLEGEGK